VSISFAPILLSVTLVPAVEVSQSMPLKKLFKGSPLGTIGIFLLGGIYAAQSGMGAVFGSQIGLTPNTIALFVAMLFAGALFMQYPIGWISDRVDRRQLIFWASCIGCISCLVGWTTDNAFIPLMTAAFVSGGMTAPLYALFLAYTNDSLEADEMPAASGGLVFTFGLGAIIGPLLIGWAMQVLGPSAFWLVIGVAFAGISVYALYCMTQKGEEVSVEDTDSYLGVLPTASLVAVEAATEWAVEHAEAEREAEHETEDKQEEESSQETLK